MYAIYLAPVLFSGHWTWSGYNFLNDTNYQLLIADWIRSDAATPVLGLSNSGNALGTYLLNDYPLGAHAHLAGLTSVLRIPVEVGYQAYVAAAAGVAAMAAQFTLRSLRMPRVLAAAGATLSLGAALTVQFGYQGSLKEIVFVTTLFVAGAFAQFVASSERRSRGAPVVFGVLLAAGLGAFSAAGLPYLGILALIFAVGFVLTYGWRTRATWIAVLGGVAALTVLSLPSLDAIVNFYNIVVSTYAGGAPSAGGLSSPSALGQLQAPLKGWQLFGVWLRGDYIRQVQHAAVWQTQTAAIMIGAAGVVGLVASVVRRHWGILAVLLPAPLGLAILAPRVTPYVDAKLYAVAAPSVVLAAAIGLWVIGRRLLVLAAPVAVAAGAAIAYSDALAYHHTPIAPTDRLEAITDIGQRYEGKGPILFNEFEEFAKYFGRKANLNVSTDSTAVTFIDLRNSTEPFVGRTYDLDQQKLDYVERFEWVVTRREPGQSRPPANFELEYRNQYYAVWHRTLAPVVVDHLPIGDVRHLYGSGNVAAAVKKCRDILSFARGTAKDTALVAARQPEQFYMWVPGGFTFFSPGWIADGQYPGEAEMRTPGRVIGPIAVRGGRYELWVRGSTGRPFVGYVNGRKVGEAGAINTPGGWLRIADVTLPPGRSEIEIRRPGGSLSPGDAARSRFGGVSVVHVGDEQLVRVPRGRARSLCNKPWDWIEAVRS